MWEQKTEDKGIWNEYVNNVTGESSIKEHKTKVLWKSCSKDNHYWELVGNRELICKKCKAKSFLIPGKNKLINGQLQDI